jgi:hypothetical protein
MYLADFGLAILAGFGIDAIFRAVPSYSGEHLAYSWEPLSRVLKWAAVTCIAALAYPVILGHGDPNPWISLSLVFILLSYGLFLHIIRGNHGAWSRFLVIALVCLDLSAFDWSAANKIEANAKGQDEMARLLSLRRTANFLQSRPGPFRVQVLAQSAPNIGDMFGIQEIMGSGATMQEDYDRIKGQTDLLNTRYTIRPAAAKEPGAIYEDSAWKVYENANAYPRAWLVHKTAVEPDRDKLLTRLNEPGLDTHSIALLSAPLNPAIDAAGETHDEQAEFRQVREDRVEVAVHANRPGLLVVSELFYPGWHATVNDRPAEIWNVDGALRGVVVPAGKSHVFMYYAPASFFSGMAVTIAAFLCGGILVLTLVRKAFQP